MVCGPASSTSCDTLTICCINTNGVSTYLLSDRDELTSAVKMQICAGEINFTGPVTMHFNNNIGCGGKHKRFE